MQNKNSKFTPLNTKVFSSYTWPYQINSWALDELFPLAETKSGMKIHLKRFKKQKKKQAWMMFKSKTKQSAFCVVLIIRLLPVVLFINRLVNLKKRGWSPTRPSIWWCQWFCCTNVLIKFGNVISKH